MPKITDYYSGSDSALKPNDIGDGLVVTIESHRTKTWDDGSKTLYLGLVGEEKEFRCNVTNMKRMAEMYGDEVDDWMGKTVELLPDKTKDKQGKTIDTIIVRVRKTARNAPKSAAKPKFDERNPPPLDDEIPL